MYRFKAARAEREPVCRLLWERFRDQDAHQCALLRAWLRAELGEHVGGVKTAHPTLPEGVDDVGRRDRALGDGFESVIPDDDLRASRPHLPIEAHPHTQLQDAHRPPGFL